MNSGDADLDEARLPRGDPAQDRQALRGRRPARRGAGRRRARARGRRWRDYGMHLGTAFQLVDDVLDYSGDAASIGKNLGDDLAEGKMTLPLIRRSRRAAADGCGARCASAHHAAATLTDFAPRAGAARAHRRARLRARLRAARETDAAAACARRVARIRVQTQTLLELASFAARSDVLNSRIPGPNNPLRLHDGDRFRGESDARRSAATRPRSCTCRAARSRQHIGV